LQTEQPVATLVANEIKVADEVWIAAALLQKEHPKQADFSVEEIVERVRREKLHEPLRPGVYIHVQMHCVANRPPNPGRYRMLFETAPGRRRLFKGGDPYDLRREGAKTVPKAHDIPERYRVLLNWYADWSKSQPVREGRFEGLFELFGSGRDLWANEHADEYVNRLREGWE
jgi:hypothetical protein